MTKSDHLIFGPGPSPPIRELHERINVVHNAQFELGRRLSQQEAELARLVNDVLVLANLVRGLVDG
jgi:hypothetical protein